ncbi:MAG: dihydrofolate reductase [Clostridiales bacterium]|nr:dihydrofolate reductase [Clostridiales bacterium]
MKAIVIVDRKLGMGLDGGLQFNLPKDLKYFKQQTRDKILVMGRATLESLPGGRPLPYRRNIVLTRQPGYAVEGAEVVHSIPELAALVGNRPGDEVMLLGGQQLFEQLLPCCDTALVTKVDTEHPADTFFPDLDHTPGWEMTICAPTQEENGLRFRFCAYTNRKVRPLVEEPAG